MKLISFIVFTLFLGKSYSFLDPDFGWHIKMGELIFSSGIPALDPFSYTMPSYLFVDHEWLSDLIVYFLFQNIGWTLLTILFSVLATLAVIIPFLTRPRKYNFLPIILGAGFLVSFAGIRMQVITFLFFSILITILFNKKIYEKYKYFLPFLFLIWVNLHGGFAMGIVVYFLYLLADLVTNKKINKLNWSIFSLSFLATFINPYSWRIWQEIWTTATDSSLHSKINEWMPAFLTYNPILLIIIVISAYLIIKYRKSFSLFEKLLYIGFLILGLLSIRNMTFWVIVVLPLMHMGLLVLETDVSRIKYGKERLKKAYSAFLSLILIFIFVIYFMGLREWLAYDKNSAYPASAVEYLRLNESNGQIFSIYDWGGYLILKLPEKKVFIDGRMPSWEKENAYASESKNAHKEYRDLIDGNIKFSDAVSKYGIDTVLLPNKLKQSSVLIEKIKESKFGSVYSQLEKEGWKIVFEDKFAVIYKKN